MYTNAHMLRRETMNNVTIIKLVPDSQHRCGVFSVVVVVVVVVVVIIIIIIISSIILMTLTFKEP